MKCPLFVQVLEQKGGLYDSQAMSCLQEGCAWWEETQDLCSVKEMGRALGYISVDITQLLEKMAQPTYTFRCHDCGLTFSSGAGDKAELPAGWTRGEYVDGKSFNLCDRCTADRK